MPLLFLGAVLEDFHYRMGLIFSVQNFSSRSVRSRLQKSYTYMRLQRGYDACLESKLIFRIFK